MNLIQQTKWKKSFYDLLENFIVSSLKDEEQTINLKMINEKSTRTKIFNLQLKILKAS